MIAAWRKKLGLDTVVVVDILLEGANSLGIHVTPLLDRSSVPDHRLFATLLLPGLGPTSRTNEGAI